MNILSNIKVRAAIVVRHISQSTTACLLSMTKGNLGSLTLSHWEIAITTGLGVGLISLIASFGNLVKLQTSRFGVAFIAFVGTFIADYINHAAWPEALATGAGAALLSLTLSLTPLDKFIAKLQGGEEQEEEA
ncbi:hypothetical protein [Legionella cardiaca]|uniref:Phage holin n=1 Tax=Legionella cardiaca TaxID=1071983 RepID=A0ABY8AUN5_9GAMM|nr:hypothetical protein [Legionella cardiaca]WED43871.1 hypothetical protein PXX05_03560 [Legionella cardiaca]